MKLVRKDHWQGEQIPKLISFLSVKTMSFRGYFPVLGLWLPSPLVGSKCRILLELGTKSMAWNRNSGMHGPMVLASLEPRPKSPKLLSPQVNGMEVALWGPILFILTVHFHITQGYCFHFLLSFIPHKMLNILVPIFVPSSECVAFVPVLVTVLTALTKCLTNASRLTVCESSLPRREWWQEYHLVTWAKSTTCWGTWSCGYRVLHTTSPGHMDTERYMLGLWSRGHRVLFVGGQLPVFMQNLSPRNAAVYTQSETFLLR